MKQKRMNKSILAAILFLILVSGSLFYWYQIRPAQIKHDCSWIQDNWEGKSWWREAYDWEYKFCLHDKGL